MSEAERLQYANKINGLVSRFIRLDTRGGQAMLVLERIYPLDYRAIEQDVRAIIFDVFADELRELHKNGFVHRDVIRSSKADGEKFDNIFLTKEGIRLIDAGISYIRTEQNKKYFDVFVKKELEELELFKEYFLSR